MHDADPSEQAVEIDGVTKTFGTHVAVDRLSLSVPAGSIYGFIGPNGSGKTTTLRMIMNILRPDRGTIRVFGATAGPGATDHIGYMPEERGLYRKMRVREALEFHADLKDGQDIRRNVAAWLERFELTDWAHRKIEALSKGMAQKVQFIATVVARPRLVILDEPFTGLDPVNADTLESAILELHRAGTTVILSTHDMSLAEKISDFIFMICGGRKVLDGTLDAIQRQHGRPAIRLQLQEPERALPEIAGVASMRKAGRSVELELSDTRDPNEIVHEIMRTHRLIKFEIARPSLHDIFVRIVRPPPELLPDA